MGMVQPFHSRTHTITQTLIPSSFLLYYHKISQNGEHFSKLAFRGSGLTLVCAQGSIVSAIGGGINAIISAIANVIMTIVSVIVTVSIVVVW